jgi:hypothetical protein
MMIIAYEKLIYHFDLEIIQEMIIAIYLDDYAL